MEIVGIPLVDASRYYLDAHKMRQEERLWSMWSSMATSPYVGDNFPSYEEFKEQHGVASIKDKSKEPENKSNYKGDDLTSFV